MRGSIRLGGRWLAFRAREVRAPHRGFVWAARVGGVMAGSDHYTDGQGAMSWKLLGLIPWSEPPEVTWHVVPRAAQR